MDPTKEMSCFIYPCQHNRCPPLSHATVNNLLAGSPQLHTAAEWTRRVGRGDMGHGVHLPHPLRVSELIRVSEHTVCE